MTKDDFVSLVGTLMPDMEPLDSAAFKMAVAQNTAIGNASKMQSKWEAMFRDRFVLALRRKEFQPTYEFENSDARLHVDDFLEASRYSFRQIDYSVGSLHDERDSFIHIFFKHKQSLVDRMLCRLGKSWGDVTILRSTIRKHPRQKSVHVLDRVFRAYS